MAKRVHHHRSLLSAVTENQTEPGKWPEDLSEKIAYLEPDLPPPYSGADLSLERLSDVSYGPGTLCQHDGRPAFVCVPPPEHMPGYPDYVLIRYLDGKRERILANPYECAVGLDG